MDFNLIKQRIGEFTTPFYCYDLGILHRTINACKSALPENFHVHFALKANTEDKILSALSANGFGADCVSGYEVKHALENGFKPKDIVFAGVGKSDAEIQYALDSNIDCFNVESVQELEVIAELAKKSNKIARVALRLNPNVKADTHHYITTGIGDNKFGIDARDVESASEVIENNASLKLVGIHFHIGSQITQLDNFKNLCTRANEWFNFFKEKGHKLEILNLGGGYGIDYQNPVDNAVPDFKAFFKVYEELLDVPDDVQIYFELGRALVGNCGALITQVLYGKRNGSTNYLIVDGGMTELLRPSLYNAYHQIRSLSESEETELYTIAGPVCESSDVFGKRIELPLSKRGDVLAIMSAGAYGSVMSSNYNLRPQNKVMFI